MSSTALEPELAGVSGPPAGRSLATVLAVVGIPMFMVTLDNLVVTNALPVIKTELGASLTDLQWFINAYTLSFAALLLTASAIGDRLGRRRIFLAGITLFTLASAACAMATEPWMLIAALPLYLYITPLDHYYYLPHNDTAILLNDDAAAHVGWAFIFAAIFFAYRGIVTAESGARSRFSLATEAN